MFWAANLNSVPILFEKIDGESWFKIPNVDSLPPFFMTVVSDSNHWMFIASNGGLTAGRKNSDLALFPYYTDDKIIRSTDTTGSKTVFQLNKDGKLQNWEPFSNRCPDEYRIERNLFKNKYGNKIRFEEINHDLKLSYSYEWNSSNKYGFVKKSRLTNHSSEDLKIRVLDGLQNILPYGVGSDLQMKQSNLVGAYKRNELISDLGIGIYALSAIIVDRAEPSEALKANVVWSQGLDHPVYLLSTEQLEEFRAGKKLSQETDLKAKRGSYLACAEILLPGSGGEKEWRIVANVNQDQSDVVFLEKQLNTPEELIRDVSEDIDRGTENLIRLVAHADGLQKTADSLKDTRHFANVMFNIMRGGIFDHNYDIENQDFIQHLKKTNKDVYKRHRDELSRLDKTISLIELKDALKEIEDPDLERVSMEYLPLKFSRRHGDPSRPWNKFSIETRSEVDGSKILNYQGNWRDIFQNWEALAHSYPIFMDGMISRFLNASTFDGYNPYRITKDGFDWEVIEPEDPWSFIGYWGDHQIIYLLKFLEFKSKYEPDGLQALFGKESFVYANVPYRIKKYEEILQDPKDTIEFDSDLDKELRRKMAELGSDAAVLRNKNGKIYHVNFTEKLLVTALAKLSNLVAEGGIWMNTQRPEWNDANNALVGNGLSMVTLYYLCRFVQFLLTVTEGMEDEETRISSELHGFYSSVKKVLIGNKDLLKDKIDDKIRKEITDKLGKAGSDYRHQIYDHGFSGNKERLTFLNLREFLSTSLLYLEHSIRANKRNDNLYHSYNLLDIGDDAMSVSYLSEMLEGQVAVLSSEYLKPEESLDVLDALRRSSLYRSDQNSYILYPNKDLPGFMEKNHIPADRVKESELLIKLENSGQTSIIQRDAKGIYHFNGNFRNKKDLKAALDELQQTEHCDLVEKDRALVMDVFEEVFDHRSFTGRSGTFFAYEGLGSIYWHMVSKLHLAVAEVYTRVAESGSDKDVLKSLSEHFDEIGEGIGVHKDPEVYGAFPTDPYSHTPAHRGAQQPGMTGQVKEDILVRFMELGISVKDGRLAFNPKLLKKDEFISESRITTLRNTNAEAKNIDLQPGQLCFSVCQIPVIYSISDKNEVTVKYVNGNSVKVEGNELDRDLSAEIFSRNPEVEKVEVQLDEGELR